MGYDIALLCCACVQLSVIRVSYMLAPCPVRPRAYVCVSPQVDTVLVYENDNALEAADTPFTPDRDHWWQASVARQPTTCEVEWVDAEHPLFLLYTSGSTGV